MSKVSYRPNITDAQRSEASHVIQLIDLSAEPRTKDLIERYKHIERLETRDVETSNGRPYIVSVAGFKTNDSTDFANDQT